MNTWPRSLKRVHWNKEHTQNTKEKFSKILYDTESFPKSLMIKIKGLQIFDFVNNPLFRFETKEPPWYLAGVWCHYRIPAQHRNKELTVRYSLDTDPAPTDPSPRKTLNSLVCRSGGRFRGPGLESSTTCDVLSAHPRGRCGMWTGVAEKKRKAVGSNPNNTRQTSEQVPSSIFCRASHPLSSLFSICSFSPLLPFSHFSCFRISLLARYRLLLPLVCTPVFLSLLPTPPRYYGQEEVGSQASTQEESGEAGNCFQLPLLQSWQQRRMPHVFFFSFFPKPQILVFPDSVSVRSMKIWNCGPFLQGFFFVLRQCCFKIGVPTFLTRTRVLSWRTWF